MGGWCWWQGWGGVTLSRPGKERRGGGGGRPGGGGVGGGRGRGRRVDVRVINEMVQKQSAFVDKLTAEVGKVIVGQKAMIERILIGLLTGGHVLLEGCPAWPRR